MIGGIASQNAWNYRSQYIMMLCTLIVDYHYADFPEFKREELEKVVWVGMACDMGAQKLWDEAFL
jgi:hypothetical protein